MEFNEDEELKKIQEKKAEQEKRNNELVLAEKVNNSIAECYDKTIANNSQKMQSLTDKLFNAEVETREKQIDGRKRVLQAQSDKDVTKAQTELDVERTERSKTILKAQGLTEKLPPAFRVTALIIGYPFFVLYLLTLGWVIQFITFVAKGFLTMIFDCADRYADLNRKFTENANNKDFKLGKALIGILKWTLILGAVIVILVLLLKK